MNSNDMRSNFFFVPQGVAFLSIATRAARALAADYTRVEREHGKAITPRNIFQMLADDFTDGKADSHFAMEENQSWIRIEPKTQAANWLFNFMDQMQTIESDGKIYKSWPMLNKFIKTIEKENGLEHPEPEEKTQETQDRKETKEGTERTTDIEELPE